MAIKKLGSIEIDNNYSVLLTGRDGFDTTATIHICNRNSFDIYIYITYSDKNDITVKPEDHVYYNYHLAANETKDIRGIAIESGCSLLVMSTHTNVSAVAYGFEEEIN